MIRLLVVGVLVCLPAFAARSLSLSTDRVAPGGEVVVEWASDDEVGRAEWIGLFYLGSPTDEKKRLPAIWKSRLTAGKSGRLEVTAPDERGEYEFRHLRNESGEVLTRSASFSVMRMRATPAAVAVGGKLEIEWVAPRNETRQDWIGLFPVDGKDAVQKQTTEGASGGKLTWKAPKKEGAYVVRYFSGEKEVESLRSAVIPVVGCARETKTPIRHLVVLVPENHSFDSYFGKYCEAPTGSMPKCTEGRKCCEAGPAKDPGTGKPYVELTEKEHGEWDPPHSRKCMLAAQNGGKMDGYVNGLCGNARNFAYADATTVGTYWKWAEQYAMGDRVFHSVAGASASNNMYLAQGKFAFEDNVHYPPAKAGHCGQTPQRWYDEPTIADVMQACGLDSTWFVEGYDVAAKAHPKCLAGWPASYDPSDIPIAYYRQHADQARSMRDYKELKELVEAKKLPAVSFIKSLGWKTEHPGSGIKMADGAAFAKEIFDLIQSTDYAKDTLFLMTPDEGGGYFDHVKPPADSTVDGQPYGNRIYLLAMGKFAKTNHVSHEVMEHSSILRFIQWNWLGGRTGLLRARDATANGIGSLLDPRATGVKVP